MENPLHILVDSDGAAILDEDGRLQFVELDEQYLEEEATIIAATTSEAVLNILELSQEG